MGIDRAMSDRFRYQLPYPIAINYKLIGASPEPNARRLSQILKTAEMTARFLGIIALSEMRRAAPQGGMGAAGADLTHRFATPSFGTWLWILRQSLTSLRAAGADLFLRDLLTFHLDAQGQPTDAARALDELCMTRNRCAHDQVPASEWPRSVPTACEESMALLDQVLTAATFLTASHLVVVSPLTVEKRLGMEPRFVRNKVLLTGCSDAFDHEQDTSDELSETSEVLLMASEHRAYLNLAPLIVYSHDGVDPREVDGERRELRTEIRDVFLYDGGRTGDRRYQACGKGGDLRTRGLAERDVIETQLAALMRSLCVPGGS